MLLPATRTFSQATAQGIAAEGIYGVGVQLGMAEMGSAMGADPATLAQGLYYAHGLAQASGCIPTDEIDSIRAAMLQTSNSRTLTQRISTYRQQLANYIAAHCLCGGGQPACGDISGHWQHGDNGEYWLLTPTGQGLYSAKEYGFGAATGTARITGPHQFRIDYTVGNTGNAGYYVVTLDNNDCNTGQGQWADKNASGTRPFHRIVVGR
jgi:hypothetical protein